jgi:hypothetical protein
VRVAAGIGRDVGHGSGLLPLPPKEDILGRPGPPGLDDGSGRSDRRRKGGRFGPYPFSTGGGIVDDYDNLLFALENQTRTVYSTAAP